MKKMEPRSVSVRLVVLDLGKFHADSSYLHNYHVLMCACACDMKMISDCSI